MEYIISDVFQERNGLRHLNKVCLLEHAILQCGNLKKHVLNLCFLENNKERYIFDSCDKLKMAAFSALHLLLFFFFSPPPTECFIWMIGIKLDLLPRPVIIGIYYMAVSYAVEIAACMSWMSTAVWYEDIINMVFKAS